MADLGRLVLCVGDAHIPERLKIKNLPKIVFLSERDFLCFLRPNDKKPFEIHNFRLNFVQNPEPDVNFFSPKSWFCIRATDIPPQFADMLKNDKINVWAKF